jgi:CMP-N-acetylneuraminic acid synthetase
MKINCIIPAKGTSERLKNKNLLKIGGDSLVRLVCEKMLKSEHIDEVYLDTESKEIISQVMDLKKSGLKFISRPVCLANNDIGANEMMIYGLHSVSECDILLQTFSTSPTLTINTIDMCIEKFMDNLSTHDSFFTVSKVQEYFWSEGNPVNFSSDELPNSFDLEPLMMETHGLYGIKVDSLLEYKRRVGKKPLLIEIPKSEAIDIDDQEDFIIGKAVLDV